ncbi:sec14 cytosolic factor [Nannochloropsis gaditana]|uniref:Sec14 cytosolic factor n=1 Tax=Nannochloropsis gaditana TaxID=72520 RepID=W7TSM0_9STRA|nr:sec14 cytosolic factor [Nannochloropsis gaditana]
MERQRDILECQYNQEKFRERGQQADQQSALVDATQSIDVVPSYVGGRQPLPEELQLMAEFQRVLDSANVILPRNFWEANYHESRCSLFWRFLVANDGHVIRAKNQLARDVAWRDEIRLKDLQNMARKDVVGIEDAFFIRHYPCLCLGFEDGSENYSPVVYRRLTHLNTKVLAEKGVTVEKMIKHELWQYEKDCRLLFEHPESFPPRQLKVRIF